MAGRFPSLFKVFRGKKKKSPGVSPAQQPEEPELVQPMQDGAAMDLTQEQKPTRGRFRRALKMFRKFVPVHTRKTSSTAAESTAEPDSRLTELQAEPDVSPDLAECSEDSDMARNDDRAKADTAVTEDVAMTNADTGETQGVAHTDTTPTLSQDLIDDYFMEPHVSSQQHLQSHRAAARMWAAIGSSGPTVVKVLPTLLCVMENWPLHSMSTSDGDNKDVFALAATLVIWVIVQVPQCHEAMILYSSRLFVALLLHVVISTQQMPPEEVDNFWRACQEDHCLPSKPNRFAVQTMKSLLCRLRCENVVMAMECKRGWDMLLCADTQHCAVGLLARDTGERLDLCQSVWEGIPPPTSGSWCLFPLAREMRRDLAPLCSRIALHLLRLLSTQEPDWDLPFLAFLVEPCAVLGSCRPGPLSLSCAFQVLKCLDLTKCGDDVVKVMSRYLQSKCKERRCLALRGVVALSKDPLMARRMCSLSQSLLELLAYADGGVLGMTLRVFTNMLQNKHIGISRTTAPKLAEALLELFDHDKSQVQLLSIDLFCKVMELVVDEGKMSLKTIVNKSLYPLLIHCHDENQDVAKVRFCVMLLDLWEGARLPPALAPPGLQPPPGLGTGPRLLCPELRGHLHISAALQASHGALVCAAKFLKRRNLEELLKKDQLLKVAECLLAEDRSRAAEHLRQALPYLQSPQEPLQQAAIRFTGEPELPPLPAPPRRSSAPAPPAAPAAASGPGAVEPRLPSGLLPPSRSRALGRQDAARARAEPCRARRACGHSAGSAAGRDGAVPLPGP
ncbi:hypothetical protein Nmel_010018 [Mimus melanotis]